MRFLISFIAVVFLMGCTEVELASHMLKKALPGETASTSIGHYKIGNPYRIKGRLYVPQEQFSMTETGIASWYGPNFHAKKTANGEIFDQNALTAAHRTLQIPSMIKVTNLDNGKSIALRVNDRGPYSRGRVLDVSKRGAELLGYKNAGTARVRIEVLGEESRILASMAKQGLSTSGTEVAYNKTGSITGKYAKYQQDDDERNTSIMPAVQHETVPMGTPAKPAVIEVAKLPPLNTYPAQKLVEKTAIAPTNLYVQAGSFTSHGNASQLRNKLSSMGRSAIYEADVNGTSFYRVRLGPFQNTGDADAALAQLVDQGNNQAILIVE